MREDIDRLMTIANKEERHIIGLMSGTSLDGLDIAHVRIKGQGRATQLQTLHFTTIDYDDAYRNKVRQVFAKKKVDFELLTCLNPWIAAQHAGMIKKALRRWDVQTKEIDLIASHGQTVYHAPSQQHGRRNFPNATLQIGDGDHMAHLLGVITLSDFRQKHIAAGGEGAPLVLYGDYLLFGNEKESRILLNLGGIANLTYLPAGASFGETICSDVGPGNTLMDAYVQKHFGIPYDKDAHIAARGRLSKPLLESFLDHAFFFIDEAKTTGPEIFNLEYIEKCLEAIADSPSNEDVLHTLAHLTAEGIVLFLNKHGIERNDRLPIYLSGGGIHNPLVYRLLKHKLNPAPLRSVHSLGIDPDAKEAILFAVLANETIGGVPMDISHPYYPSVSMGKISLPN